MITTNANSNQQTDKSIYLPRIKVIGIGGAGCNAVNRMIDMGVRNVEFIAANTDQQSLIKSKASRKIQLGPLSTRGLGAGGDPKVGSKAALESLEEIKSAMSGADMVFLTSGLGGGTGTGAIPIFAELSRKIGAVTISIVTTPFSFEMGHRSSNASNGLVELRKFSNTLISIPNDRLLHAAPKNLPIETTFILADDILRQAVQGVTELIFNPGIINVDFAHIRSLMANGGGSIMVIGQGSGENKSKTAVQQALNHPLLETSNLEKVSGVIVNFTGDSTLTLFEVRDALTFLSEETGNQCEIVFGVSVDPRMEGRCQAILVMTGLGAHVVDTTVGTDTMHNKNQGIDIPDDLQIIKHERMFRANPFQNNEMLDVPAFIRKRERLALDSIL